MNLKFPFLLLAIPLLSGTLSATTTLIGGSFGNGDFNTTTTLLDGGSFEQTASWVNLSTTGTQATQATRNNLWFDDLNRTRNAQLNNVDTTVFGQDTGHTIAFGDVFDLSYVWRDAANWNLLIDKVRVTLFTTGDNTLTGALDSNLVVTTSGLITTSGSYQPEVFDDFYTAVVGDVGKTLFVRMDTENDGTTGLARLDNFVLEVTPVPEPSSSLLLLGLVLGLGLRRRR
jgi:hypothetical protein